MKAMIQVKVCRPHLHPTSELINQLFSSPPSLKRMLGVPGNWVYEERVTIEGPNGNRINVAMVGPPRERVQLALHASHAPVLGIMNLPRRISGDLHATTGFYAIGPKGRVAMMSGAIIEAPHMHVPEYLGLSDGELVDINIGIAKIEAVPVKVNRGALFKGEIHIDEEEANELCIREYDWAVITRSKMRFLLQS